ncbi:hypothetical protein D9758_002033 [Tetrapyrgos nigripes]|uniref:Autophagy-related protein 27 n=1 Tax=Tetrapyrgos nigripes TaxID=182062 RepID=A0A8H5GTY7_9AGAR|nr:hypothetical protein D9758_002033 [Tetrapyrgos nigripes]
MIPRPLLLVMLWTSAVLSIQDSSFDCKFNIGSTKFDLTSLAKEQTVNRTRETPPTKMKDVFTFNLCSDLQLTDTLGKQDQCPEGTRGCLTKVNVKEDVERVVSVIQVAKTSSLDASYSMLSSPNGISLVFHGATYPNDSSPQQYLNLTLLCDQSPDTDPIKFVSYNGSELRVEWVTSAACATENGGGDSGSGNEDDGSSRSYGSGLGWFFLVLLLAFAAYFGLGAYYNYTTYGASGLDLIPHRDFWKEVPYLLRDVVSHLCSVVRPRRTSSRGGYIAV